MVFKQLGQFSQILRQAQEMGGKVAEIREKLKLERVIGSAGGGLVEVEMNGEGEVLRVSLDAMLIERRETDVLEDLLPTAFNQAATRAKQCLADAMKQATSDLNLPIPGLEEAFAKVMQQFPGSP